MAQQHTATTYVLGHQDAELARLEQQGRFLRGLTRDVLVRAGLREGMSVLDFGAGMGDVSLIAAEIVGPSGAVLAVDRAEVAAQRAQARFDALGVRQASTRVGDERLVDELAEAGGFDAVIGRLVLLHQPDPAATVARLAAAVRPGGVIAFHEIEISAGCWSEPRLPLLETVWGWIVEAFTSGGMVTDIGARIAQGMDAAGLIEPCVVREGRVERGQGSDATAWLARTAETLAPLIQARGIATARQMMIDTLAARLHTEAVEAHGSFIPVFFSSAWARKPGCSHLE